MAVLDEIGADEAWSAAVDRDRGAVLDLFEDIFKHKSFTGRSGTMYGYEGQGCIYWHMVAKLLLAVQEVLLDADPDALTPDLRFELSRMYFRVRAGIGYEKERRHLRRLPHRPLFPYAGPRRGQAAGHDRPG